MVEPFKIKKEKKHQTYKARQDMTLT